MYEKSESGIPRFRSFREGPGGGGDGRDGTDGTDPSEALSVEFEEHMQCVNLGVLGTLLLRTPPTTYPPRRRR